MLARILLVLLMALLPMPAAGAAPACHAATAASMHHGSGGMPAEDVRHADQHGCIGCAPLPDQPRTTDKTVAPAGRPDPVAVAALDLGRAGPPALPPPRRG